MKASNLGLGSPANSGACANDGGRTDIGLRLTEMSLRAGTGDVDLDFVEDENWKNVYFYIGEGAGESGWRYARCLLVYHVCHCGA